MAFLKYISFAFCSAAIVFGTVHIERNTSVVMSFKNLLGLDTTNLAAAQNGEETEGLLSMAVAVVSGETDVSDLISLGGGEEKLHKFPAPLTGWMIEEKSLKESDAQAFGLAQGEGAYYYRENLVMALSISSGEAVVPTGEGTQATTYKLSKNDDNLLEWNGQVLPFQKDPKSGYGQVKVVADDGSLIQIRGNGSKEIFAEFLGQIPALGGDIDAEMPEVNG